MRSSDADYEAIEDALYPHQLRTIHDLAGAMGLAPRAWSEHTIARVVAKDLAVANVIRDWVLEGRSQRQALNEAASRFNLDAETLQRRYRTIRRRNSPA